MKRLPASLYWQHQIDLEECVQKNTSNEQAGRVEAMSRRVE